MFTTSSIQLSGRRILVVEDDYFAAQEMSEAVVNAGGSVVGPVASVEEALELVARTEPVDAAILDINLGGSKVFPVAQALRDQGIAIVFVTGYDDWIIPQQYEDVPIFRKPADADNVVRLLFVRK